MEIGANQVRFVILRYMLKYDFGQFFSSDWLCTRMIFDKTYYDVQFSRIEELEQATAWLDLFLRSHHQLKNFEFVDPAIVFCHDRTSGSVVLVWDGEECTTCFTLTKKDVFNLIGNLKTQLKKFPCRCLRKHEILDNNFYFCVILPVI